MTDQSELVKRLKDVGDVYTGTFDADPPQWAKDPFNGDMAEKCGCGAWREVVRPGKTQCEVCGDNYDVQLRLKAAAALEALTAENQRLREALETARAEERETLEAERKACVGRGMAISAALMAKRGDGVQAKEILNAAGYRSADDMKKDGVDSYDIDALEAILAEIRERG